MRFYKRFLANTKIKKEVHSRVYLDFSSSTPVDHRMQSTFPLIPAEIAGANPSALHREGVALRRIVEEDRARVARVLEVHADEIIFTASATESDNLAIRGTVQTWLNNGFLPNQILIVSSELEHAAVQETITDLLLLGIKHTKVETVEGVIEPRDIVVTSDAKAVLISVLYVHNEIGTIQPLQEIAKRVRKLRKDFPFTQIIFHTDATQAPLHFTLRVPTLGVDMVTLGATKLYTQKGVGVLYKKRGLNLEPIIRGGGQERGLRAGTEPVELIHNFSYALEYANQTREKETQKVQELQQYFESEIEKHFPELRISAKDSPRTPHITHIGIPNFDSELIVIELDARGIAVSAKSACKNEEGSESAIVEKLYGKGWGGVRFSFGRTTTKKDLDRAIESLQNIFSKYKQKGKFDSLATKS